MQLSQSLPVGVDGPQYQTLSTDGGFGHVAFGGGSETTTMVIDYTVPVYETSAGGQQVLMLSNPPHQTQTTTTLVQQPVHQQQQQHPPHHHHQQGGQQHTTVLVVPPGMTVAQMPGSGPSSSTTFTTLTQQPAAPLQHGYGGGGGGGDVQQVVLVPLYQGEHGGGQQRPVQQSQPPRSFQREAYGGYAGPARRKPPLYLRDGRAGPSSGPHGSPRRHERRPRADVPREPLRAATSTPFAALSGAMAQRLRALDSVEVQAMGPDAVAHTLRALTLCRSYVARDNMRVLTQTEFMRVPPRDDGSPQERVHPALRFLVRAYDSSNVDPIPVRTLLSNSSPDAASLLRVTQDSIVGKAAGAVAKLMRSTAAQGRPVVLIPGSSPQAVNVGVKALTLARAMIAQDALDIHFQSFFRSDSPNSGDCESMVLQLFLVCAPQRAGIDPQLERTPVELPTCPVLLNDPPASS
eukprot:TRINITY_DN2988_c0_g2_i1.p1 TRINITY_DN2988_c0_g2~~TRINITY_DN2988_c0_g2_i1.p1  ORF type:complete len:463 (+),score=132.17 TRINITY_DN2988_c0_g2_i1:90-1478(+)